MAVSQSDVIPCSGTAVANWLREHASAESAAFEQEFNDALQAAQSSFDLSAANEVVRRWWLLTVSRSQPADAAELDIMDRARRGDLVQLMQLEPDGTFTRVA